MREFDAVILANGAFPTHPVPLKVLRAASQVVCCDGAVRNYPDAAVVIGDGDSVPPEYHGRLIQIDEQEDNDLTKATRYCLKALRPSSLSQFSPLGSHVSPLRIAYLGCTGKREDHTLGNISLLMRYFREFQVEGMMFTDEGYFTPANGEKTFESFPGQQVSIFNFGCSRLESDGLRWPVYAYREGWQGTLNEALSTRFTLTGDGDYLAYRTYDAKNHHA